MNAVYRDVEAVVEDLVGKLGALEIKVINAALVGRHRLNRVYDLVGITYPDWPSPPVEEAVGKKLKRAGALGAEPTIEKHGRGCGQGSSASTSSRQIVVKARSSVVGPTVPSPGDGVSCHPVAVVAFGSVFGGSRGGLSQGRFGGLSVVIPAGMMMTTRMRRSKRRTLDVW